MAIKVLGNMGHNIVHVQNGEQALNRLSRQRFDLILMDVEMPRMDGLETTRRIRRGDAGDRNRHTPIIAMTAHALTEFREKAKKSGMDEFVTKPVDFNSLREIIEKNIKGSIMVKKTSGTEENHGSPNESTIDRQKALHLIDGDEALLDELNELFVPHMEEERNNLKTKLDDEDLKEVARIAHSMKSSAEMIGALPFHRIIRQVETAALDNEAERIRQLLDSLDDELEKIAVVLTENIKSGNP
jgi:CheY-like chemotaxis protein